MAGVLTIGLGLLLAIGGAHLSVDTVSHAGAALVAVGLWMLVASRR